MSWYKTELRGSEKIQVVVTDGIPAAIQQWPHYFGYIVQENRGGQVVKHTGLGAGFFPAKEGCALTPMRATHLVDAMKEAMGETPPTL